MYRSMTKNIYFLTYNWWFYGQSISMFRSSAIFAVWFSDSKRHAITPIKYQLQGAAKETFGEAVSVRWKRRFLRLWVLWVGRMIIWNDVGLRRSETREKPVPDDCTPLFLSGLLNLRGMCTTHRGYGVFVSTWVDWDLICAIASCGGWGAPAFFFLA